MKALYPEIQRPFIPPRDTLSVKLCRHILGCTITLLILACFVACCVIAIRAEKRSGHGRRGLFFSIRR